MSREVRQQRVRELQGLRAGFVSRILALAIDFAVLIVIGFLIDGFIAVILWVTTGRPFSLLHPSHILWDIVAFVVASAYFGYSWSTTGRTVGEQVFGLRTVGLRRPRLEAALAYPRGAITVIFPIGLLWIIVSSTNSSIQDLIFRSAVVYDWSYRRPGT